MTIDTKTVPELQASLAGALAASRDFQPLLEAESEALRTADLQALSDILERKKARTETLLRASQRLLNWCAEHGIEPNFSAFSAWSQDLPPEQGDILRQNWRDLRQSLDENDRANTVNRQILTALTARNHARLTLFKNMLGSPNTYSATGTQESGALGGWVDRV